ncbi:MAG: YqiA/YcfP family alpha/beta fold hydrolase [Pseudomonadota bacterium]
MRLLFCLGLLAVLATPAFAGKANLNPEWGTAPYQAPSFFIPDEIEGKPIKDRVVVVFHGFKSAVPNGTFKRIYKLLRDTHTVIGVNYTYFDIEGTMQHLDALAKDYLAGREVVVLGTSLGGFWADWFGNRIAAKKIVLLNPVIEPKQILSKYDGKTVESERRAVTFTVTADDIAKYDGMAVEVSKEPAILLILTADDDRQVMTNTIPSFVDRGRLTLEIFPEGGHTINLKKHPARQVIRDYVLTE